MVVIAQYFGHSPQASSLETLSELTHLPIRKESRRLSISDPSSVYCLFRVLYQVLTYGGRLLSLLFRPGPKHQFSGTPTRVE